MSDAADQRFAPPQAHVADLASGEMELAGRGTRLLAAIVDGLIVAGVIWVLMMVPAIGSMMLSEQQAPKLLSLNLGSVIMGAAVFVLVQGGLLVTRGQTIGKLLFKLRIVRPDGSKPEAWRLLGLRYGVGIVMGLNAVVSMVYSLVDSLLIFRESRKCLHDTIAGTQVIKL